MTTDTDARKKKDGMRAAYRTPRNKTGNPFARGTKEYEKWRNDRRGEYRIQWLRQKNATLREMRAEYGMSEAEALSAWKAQRKEDAAIRKAKRAKAKQEDDVKFVQFVGKTIKDRARKRLAEALQYGRMIRPSRCSDCGAVGKPDAHHVDYTKPLAVLWLCRVCHMAHHGAKPRIHGKKEEGANG